MKRELKFRVCVQGTHPSLVTITIEGRLANLQKVITKIRRYFKRMEWREVD